MLNLLTGFVRDERGATAIEYGLVVAGIAIALVVAMTTLGDDLTTAFGNISDFFPDV